MAEKKSWLEVVLMPLVVALVGIGSTHFITSQQHRSAETMAAADREVKMLEIFSDKITSSEESERIFALKILATVDSDLAARLALTIAENESEPQIIRQTADQVIEEARARANSHPKVYLHIRSAESREKAVQVAEMLNESNYFAPRSMRLVNSGPDLNQLRYFKNSEETEAKKIEEYLRTIGVDVTLQYISGYEESTVIQPHHYELWFAPGEPQALQP